MNAVLKQTPGMPGSTFVSWEGTLTASAFVLAKTMPAQISFNSSSGLTSFQITVQYGYLDGETISATASEPLGIAFSLSLQELENDCPDPLANSSTPVSVLASIAVFLIEPNTVLSFSANLTIDFCAAISAACVGTTPLLLNATAVDARVYDLNLTHASMSLVGSYNCTPVLGFTATLSGDVDYHGLQGSSLLKISDGHVTFDPASGLLLNYVGTYFSWSANFQFSNGCSLLTGSGNLNVSSIFNGTSQNDSHAITVPVDMMFDRCAQVGQTVIEIDATLPGSGIPWALQDQNTTVSSVQLVATTASALTPAHYVNGIWSGMLRMLSFKHK
jgi:hypothetical protein